MTSLWTLLFKRQRHFTYAHLDSNGICLGFKQTRQPPTAAGWVLVSEAHLGWLGQPLPASARICSHATGRWQRRPLAA
ncbi:hypothetical protein [Pseudomonas sichuanensis]|uniref:Uncharacterized protein n=1 Tax=Pseudomonas sichuanensis TaxID=2213015 RepID=A0ABV0DBX6_9PSED